MAKLFRCTNCQPHREFISDRRACDQCGIDAATDSKAVRCVLPLRIHHFDPPHPKMKGVHLNVHACNPGKPIAAGSMVTGEARHVNCPACKESQAYKDAVAAGALRTDFLDSEDEVVAVSGVGVIITTKKEGCTDCG